MDCPKQNLYPIPIWGIVLYLIPITMDLKVLFCSFFHSKLFCVYNILLQWNFDLKFYSSYYWHTPLDNMKIVQSFHHIEFVMFWEQNYACQKKKLLKHRVNPPLKHLLFEGVFTNWISDYYFSTLKIDL